MATPNTGATAMKHALSQQGKTPSQSQQGAAATPPVSTPFSAAHAAFSPHGPRSSPQQVKKSPATAAGTNLMSHPSNAPINFDSPSAAAAFNALQIGGGLDLGLQGLDGLGALGRSTEDERTKRLAEVISILGASKGIVSEAALERLAKKLGLEVLWENGMGVDAAKKTLIVGGSALELLIVFSSPNIVESASLGFPESAEMVSKHAEDSGRILTANLKLAPGQSPLTKKMDAFAKNFERVAILDKLGVYPGLNLYEAVAGIYESLNRLHTRELEKIKEDAAYAGKSEEYIENVVLCTKSGSPAMNRRDLLGFTVDYWKESRLVPSITKDMADHIEKHERVWTILISCAPLRDIGVNPVRVSEKWISEDIEKAPLPDELQTGPILDWLEPENTFITTDGSKAGTGPDALGAEAPLLGPRLPEVAFHATFEPPVNIPLSLWENIQHMGTGIPFTDTPNLDTLIFPIPPGTSYDPSEPRTITCVRSVPATKSGQAGLYRQDYQSTLLVYKPIYGRALSELTFSHPRQLINMLPHLRQYAFLSRVLEKTFKQQDKSSTSPGSKQDAPRTAKATGLDDYTEFMDGLEKGLEEPVSLDVTLTLHPVPRLQIIFPFRDSTANVFLEIRENGSVHVVSQDVLDERNNVAPNGRERRAEDLGAILESVEDIAAWCEFLRTRWG